MRSKPSLHSDIETRATGASSVDIDNDTLIKGVPIVFNKLSQDLGGFRERVLPEAVDRSLKADIRALVDHDTAKILGRTRSGTLKLKKGRDGLGITIDPDVEISYARDIVRAVSRGDVSGMSFGFRVLEDDWHESKSGPPIRDILDMEIMEFSIVTFPAYESTSVEVAQRALKVFQESHTAYQWRVKLNEITQIAKS
jgi:uncharacterized protein